MPLPMVHLHVAKAVSGVTNPTDMAAYYLGSLAPDAFHSRTNKQLEDRSITHLYNNNKDIWLKNVLDFMRNNNSGIDNSYLLGYSIHLLTDIIWETDEFSLVWSRYKAATETAEDQHKAYMADMCVYDMHLYNSPLRIEIWPLLEKAKAIGIEGLVTSDEVEIDRLKTLTWYEKNEHKINTTMRQTSFEEMNTYLSSIPHKVILLI